MKKIVIPAAKLIPEELQRIGKVPAIIYPINQRIVFDFLLDEYERIASTIDVICFEEADKVHRMLESYKNCKVNIIDLPFLSDLGHTVYCGIKNVESQVIINFSDTIVLDSIYNEEGDAFFYAEDFASEDWAFFEEDNGIITNLYDQTLKSSMQKKKLFVGVFQICDCPCLKRCLEEAFTAPQKDIGTFFCALKQYSKIHPMKAVKTEKWFDIGHLDKYYSSLLAVKAREFNRITIDTNRAILRKTSDNKEKLIGEILWYLKLPTEIEYVRPRIFSFSTRFEEPYIEMEYYSYHTLHELFLYGELTQHQWRTIFQSIQFMLSDFKRYQVCGKDIRLSLEDVYLNKTIIRMEEIQDNFARFFHQGIEINGVQYKSLKDIIGILKRIIPEMLYNVDSFHIIHGDLCFSNIMVDDTFSFVKVIDPRGNFGTYDIYGDGRYELAKLFHSIDGKYDYIIKDLFEIEIDEERAAINFKINDCKQSIDLYELLILVFRDDIINIQEIELIESLLFFSMVPLHRENQKHQYAMLATGIEILDRVINIKER